MKWEPWVEYEPKGDAGLNGPRGIPEITEPPCKCCKQFVPIRDFDGLSYEGVRLCHAREMHSDFSCYRAKDE